MRIGHRTILLILFLITLILFPAVTFNSGFIRIILCLPVVLFIPGYTLLAALFPRKGNLNKVERITFSIGLSIAVMILIGIILNYCPWGISLYPVLVTTTVFIFITGLIAWCKKPLFSTDICIKIDINLSKWRKMANLDRALSVFLIMAVFITIGSISYVTAIPKQEQVFTEFYILNVDGRAEQYPKQVTLGEPIDLVIGIVNHEGKTFSYSVIVKIDGHNIKEINAINLDDKQRWEEVINIIPIKFGVEQKIEFWLYKNGDDKPYPDDPLHFYIDVL